MKKNKKIEMWFSMGSTYTFLSVMRIRPLIKIHNLNISFYPFNLRKIMKKMNNFPFSAEKESKLNYMWRDIQRRSEKYKIGKITNNINFPIKNANLANKIAIYAKQHNFLLDYLETAYKLWFFENIEPGKISSLKKTFKEINQNLEKTLLNVNTVSNNNIYETNTSLAFSKGLFGSPSFVIGEEIFFGDDRFEDAILFKKNKHTNKAE